jgi:hypothetical protein
MNLVPQGEAMHLTRNERRSSSPTRRSTSLPESAVWDLVGEQVERNQVVEHLVALKSAAERAATTADRPGAILNGIYDSSNRADSPGHAASFDPEIVEGGADGSGAENRRDQLDRQHRTRFRAQRRHQ